MPWRYWGVRHGFVATAADQGALIRVHACYTPPAPTRGAALRHRPGDAHQRSATERAARRSSRRRDPCWSAPARRRTCPPPPPALPAPTLQWQTRPANSTAAWSNVTAGTGATDRQLHHRATDARRQRRAVPRASPPMPWAASQSTAVTVSVSDLDVAPSITTQPASLSVASGSDAVFAIDARGTEALSYQWYRNGVALAGANNPVLRLTGVTLLNAGSYSVTVSNAAGDADSNAATLNVYPGTPAAVAPTIVTQPAAVTVNAGNTATFAVGVDGSGPFTFQWRRDGVNIPGATSAVLTLNSVALPICGNVFRRGQQQRRTGDREQHDHARRGTRPRPPRHRPSPRSLRRSIVAPGGSARARRGGHRQRTARLSMDGGRRAHRRRDRSRAVASHGRVNRTPATTQ